MNKQRRAAINATRAVTLITPRYETELPSFHSLAWCMSSSTSSSVDGSMHTTRGHICALALEPGCVNGDWKASEVGLRGEEAKLLEEDEQGERAVTAVVLGASEKENGGEYKSDRLHIGRKMNKALTVSQVDLSA